MTEDVLLSVVATVTGNNLFGNNAGVSSSGFTNCGLLNDSGAQVTATGNFWGAAGGPGPDPADDVCNDGGSTTATALFAATEFTVNTFPLF